MLYEVITSNGNLICAADNGGDGSGAAGSAMEIQFNDGTGHFAADSDFTWSTTTNTLTVNGTVTVATLVTTGATSTITNLESTMTDTGSLRTNAIFIDGAPTCVGENQTLLYDKDTGTFLCGADAGAGVASSFWSTTTSETAIRLVDNDYVVVVGADATTTDAKLEVNGA